MARLSINDFSLANPLYRNASVTFYVAVSGVKTATLATLYSGQTGAATLANPQKLDSKGKFKQPVYIAQSVIGTVGGISVPSHDTGIINGRDVQFRMNSSTGFVEYSNDLGVSWTSMGDPASQLFVTTAELAASGGSALAGFLQAGTGAVARTMQAKERDIVSVKDFGAVGDFVPSTGLGTNDLVALQAAFDYAKSIGHCKVVIPAGNYYLGTGEHPAAAANTSIQLLLGSQTVANAANDIEIDFQGTLYGALEGARMLVIANANNIRMNPKIVGYAGGALGASREYDWLVTVGYNSTNVTLDDDFYLTNALGHCFVVHGDLSLAGGGTSFTPKNVRLGRGVLKQRYGNGTPSPAGGSRTQHAMQAVDVEGLTVSKECVVYGSINLEPNNINQTVTLSNGNPCVATFAAGLNELNGAILNITTTVADLPTGLATGTDYFIINKSGNTCNLAASHGGAAINTSSAGSGVHTAYFHQRIIDVQINAIFRSGFVTQIHPAATADYWSDEVLGRWSSDGTEIAQGAYLQGLDIDPFIHGVSFADCSFENGLIYIQGESGPLRPGAYCATVQGCNFYKGKINIGHYSVGSPNNTRKVVIKNNTAQQINGGANGFIEIQGAISYCEISDNTLVVPDLPCVVRNPADANTLDSGHNMILRNRSLGAATCDGVTLPVTNSWPATGTTIAGNYPMTLTPMSEFANTVHSVPTASATIAAGGAAKTVTVTVSSTGAVVLRVHVAGRTAGDIDGAYAEFIAGGDFQVVNNYSITEVANVSLNASLVISSCSKNVGNFTFTVTNGSGVQAASFSVHVEALSFSLAGTPTVAIA